MKTQVSEICLHTQESYKNTKLDIYASRGLVADQCLTYMQRAIFSVQTL